MAPYVYSLGSTPDDGIMGFLETPRYSTGYATLFGAIGFTTEAHMLKPFSDRVQATHSFLGFWPIGFKDTEMISSTFAGPRASGLQRRVRCRCDGNSQIRGTAWSLRATMQEGVEPRHSRCASAVRSLEGLAQIHSLRQSI